MLNLCHSVVVPVGEVLLLLGRLGWLLLPVRLRLVIGLSLVLQTAVIRIVSGVGLVVLLNCLLVYGLRRVQDQTELNRALVGDLLAFDDGCEAGLSHLVMHEDARVRHKKFNGLLNRNIRVNHAVGQVLRVTEVRLGPVLGAPVLRQ